MSNRNDYGESLEVDLELTFVCPEAHSRTGWVTWKVHQSDHDEHFILSSISLVHYRTSIIIIYLLPFLQHLVASCKSSSHSKRGQMMHKPTSVHILLHIISVHGLSHHGKVMKLIIVFMKISWQPCFFLREQLSVLPVATGSSLLHQARCYLGYSSGVTGVCSEGIEFLSFIWTKVYKVHTAHTTFLDYQFIFELDRSRKSQNNLSRVWWINTWMCLSLGKLLNTSLE